MRALLIVAMILAAPTWLSAGQTAQKTGEKTAAQKTAAQKTGEKKTAAQKTAAQKTAAQKTAEKTDKKSTWQAIAERRAATMAARGYRGHLPGVPAGTFEGVGFGGWNCATCVGSGQLLADAQAQGADGIVYRVRLWTGGSAVRYRARRRIFTRRR